MLKYPSYSHPVISTVTVASIVAIAVLLSCSVSQMAIAETPLMAKVRSGDDVTVCLLGTSLTANGTWSDSLQSWLSSESGGGTVTVINHAVAGKASEHGLAVQTPAALTDHPDAVFIEFSMNDAATSLNISQAEARSNLNAIIDAFVTQDPSVSVILQTMNNTAADTSPYSPRTDLNGYYQIYRDVAATRGLTLIDHYPNWLGLYNDDPVTWNSYMKDAVHPNQMGEDNVLMPELKSVLVSEVPEPASAVILGLGGLLVLRRRHARG